MVNIIVVLIIIGIMMLAARYIYQSKKKGVVCIGCPYASKCSGHCHSEISNEN